MNAKKAREITEESLAGPIVKPFLDLVYKEIEKAAKNGASSISNPFGDSPIKPSLEEEIIIRKVLTGRGFSVYYASGINLKKPCSDPYAVIYW
jgi:hypothetical protein